MNSDDKPTRSDQASVDALDEVLADRAVWAQPPTELQEQIVAAIAAERDHGRRPRPLLYTLVAGAAALVLAVGIGVGLTAIHDNKLVQYSAALAGTELSPGATGKVTLTKTTSGWKIHLHADGLPRRSGNEYYEAWLKSADGILVPVGTFNQFDDVTLWSGVSPEEHPTFTVTRQEANGNPASTGEVVLKGSTERE